MLVVPLGTVTVNGDFRHILTHFNDWQYFNRLVSVDGLTLVGNSPYMQGSYTATMYIFPQNDTSLQSGPLAKAGGTGAAGAAGSPAPVAAAIPVVAPVAAAIPVAAAVAAATPVAAVAAATPAAAPEPTPAVTERRGVRRVKSYAKI